MDIRNINLIARYERKIITRNVTFSILFVIGFIGIIGFHIIAHSDWGKHLFRVDTPSIIPYTNAYLFCLFQAFATIFLCENFQKQENRKNTIDALLVRPISNLEFVAGKALAIIELFVKIDIILIFSTLIITIFASGSICSPFIYLFYFTTLTLPAIVFSTTFFLSIKTIFKSQVLATFLLLIFIVLSIGFLPGIAYGLFDYTASSIPNLFSEITGHPAIERYLLQRVIFILLSIVFFGLTVVKFSRACNDPVNKKRITRLTLIFFCCTLLASIVYLFPFYKTDNKRVKFATIYKKFENKSKVSIVAQKITYKQEGRRFRANSTLLVKNNNLKSVDTIIFYLNPSLTISCLTRDGKNIPFTREEQVIMIPGTLAPNKQANLNIDYEGSIDQDICYPEVESKIYHKALKEEYFLCPGKKFVFLDSEFTMLTPEAMWYPTSVPVTNLFNPYSSIQDFTNFSLNIVGQSGKTIISQGEKYIKKDTTCFRNEQPLNGISLLIGTMDEEIIPLDSNTLTCYHSKNTTLLQGILNASSEGKKEGAKSLWKRVENSTGDKEYPFKRMILVETPLSYQTFTRPWLAGNGYVYPELIFFPERKDKVIRDLAEWYIKRDDFDTRPLSTFEGIVFYDQFLNLIWSHLPKTIQEKCGILSNDYPIMYKIYPILGWQTDQSSNLNPEEKLRTDMPALQYLSSKSLQEACLDPSIQKSMNDIIRLKGIQLQNYILTQTTWKQFKTFIKDFTNKHKNSNIQLETFISEAHKVLGVDILPLLDTWYTEKGIASFVIKDINKFYSTKENQTTIYLGFSIQNKSKTPGLISITKSKMLAQDVSNIKNIMIHPGISQKVCIPMDTVLLTGKELTQYLYTGISFSINTNLSLNLPGAFGFDPQAKSLPSNQPIGIWQIDSSFLLPPTGTIIVDNEDSGFNITQEESLFFQKKKKKKNEYIANDLVISPQWTLCVSSDAYGNIVKSFYCKGAGKGKAQIEWNTTIKEPGQYKLFIYYFRVSNYIQWSNTPLQQYTFKHDGKEDAITINAENLFQPEVKIKYADGSKVNIKDYVLDKWVPAGEYSLNAGNIKLILHDKGLSDGEILMADAVKWVKVE